ncbi:MAG: Holliday junction branch migration protein RuvA [Acidobacteriota bacterium]|nr:Holliday junction branch migration protein RuvA [Acidobacteriota bacterium]MDH3785251.1 Holliday junction branch migration protein RuvA [Acidobacteriota bacterium]
MIGRLTGTVAECTPETLLLDVQGVGYELRVALSTFYELNEKIGQAATVYVYTHVREDALQLYGFMETSEQRAFETLISISGVGPRLGLAILSGIGVEELCLTVDAQDRGRLQKIPGVGRKTAERVLLELRDRLKIDPAAGGGPGKRPGQTQTSLRDDVVSALVNLGYSGDKAERAVDRVIDQSPDETSLEKVLRKALTAIIG